MVKGGGGGVVDGLGQELSRKRVPADRPVNTLKKGRCMVFIFILSIDSP